MTEDRWRLARSVLGIVAVVLAVGMIIAGTLVPGVLRPTHDVQILAGTELRDVLGNSDFTEKLRRATGVRLVPTYTGSLQGIQKALDTLRAPTADGSFDLSWFSTPTYLQLVTEQTGSPRLPPQKFEPIMKSPVVVGVRKNATILPQLSTGAPVTWSDIANVAAEGKMTFASTDAAASNSGFAALVSVAAAYDRSPTTPLTSEDIDQKSIARFFTGRTIKEESSGPLTDAFCANGGADAIISYESEILAASARPGCGQLQVIYPEGSVYADYPLVNLKESARTDADNIRQWMLSAEGQQSLVAAAPRRPVVAAIPRPAAIPNQDPAPISLPDLETIRQLISDYRDVLQRPSRTIFVLDVSTSMLGERINQLRDSICALTGTNPSATSQFIRFRANEKVTIIPFAGTPQRPPIDFVAQGIPPNFSAACDAVRSLPLRNDGTAVFDAVQAAWDFVADQRSSNEGYCTTIVLMTDGESITGRTIDDLGPAQAPTFTIRFGDASPEELEKLAQRAGGRLFDATQQSLRDVFEETRSVGC